MMQYRETEKARERDRNTRKKGKRMCDGSTRQHCRHHRRYPRLLEQLLV